MCLMVDSVPSDDFQQHDWHHKLDSDSVDNCLLLIPWILQGNLHEAHILYLLLVAIGDPVEDLVCHLNVHSSNQIFVNPLAQQQIYFGIQKYLWT